MNLYAKIIKIELQAICLTCSFFFLPLASGQHSNTWAIGLFRAIDFNTTPVSMAHSAICSDTDFIITPAEAEESVSYSDCNGKLLIYGSRTQLWGKNHQPLQNGFFVSNTGPTTNLLIPKPNSSRYLYYFYQNQFYQANNCNLCYAIIDLNANNGNGAVISKDIVIDNNIMLSHNLTFALHQNNRDIWLVNGTDHKTCKAYLLTDTGLVLNPKITSNVFSGNSGTAQASITKSRYANFNNISGHFKMTHDGKNLISAGIDSITTKAGCSIMYNFDNSTGLLSNPQVLMKFSDISLSPVTNNGNTFNINNFYNTEVSPNDSFIYFATTANDHKKNSIVQVNRFTKTKVKVFSFLDGNGLYGGMQLGPDGKIYSIFAYSGRSVLARIEYPNLLGSSSTFRKWYPDSIYNFLIEFPSIYQQYKKLYFNAGSACQDTTHITVDIDTTFTDLTIYFGDGDSTVFQSPLKKMYILRHHYQTTGAYFLRLKAGNPVCNSFTLTGDTINVAMVPKRVSSARLQLPGCDTTRLNLTDSFIHTTSAIYTWQILKPDTFKAPAGLNTITTSTVFKEKNNALKGYFKLNIGNKECPDFKMYNDSVTLTFLPKPQIKYNVNSSGNAGQKNNKPLFSDCVPLQLYFSDTTAGLQKGNIAVGLFTQHYINAQAVSLQFSKGSYTAVINDTNTAGCVAIDTFYLEAYANPDLQWVVGTSQQCMNNNSFSVNNSNYTNDSNLTFLNWGDGDSVQLGSGSMALHHFLKTGNYQLTFRAKNDKLCAAGLDTTLLVFPSVSAVFNLNRDSQCLKGNRFVFNCKDTSQAINNWTFDDGSNGMNTGNSDMIHCYKRDSIYSVKNIVITNNNCRDTFTQLLHVLPSPQINTLFKDTGFCLGSATSFFELQLSSSPANIMHTIDWGDGKSAQQNAVNGTYMNAYGLKEGRWQIQITAGLGRCMDTVKQMVEIYDPYSHLIINGFGACVGDSVGYFIQNLKPQNVINEEWWINDTLKGTGNRFTRLYSQPGRYKVGLRMQSEQGCKTTLNLSSELYEKPKADYNYAYLSRDANGYLFHFTDKSKNATTWLWKYGNSGYSSEQNPDHIFTDTGFLKVELKVSNQGLCFDSTVIIVPVFERIAFFFPNAFSPNGNGINDGYGVDSGQVSLIKEYRLMIFNRWGEMIFKSHDATERWQPDKGQLGVFLMKVEIKDVYNMKQEIIGAVEVLK